MSYSKKIVKLVVVLVVALLASAGGRSASAQSAGIPSDHPRTQEEKDLGLPAMPHDSLLIPVRMKFANEVRDEEWASAAEGRVDDLLSQSAYDSLFGDYDAECRENLCRVILIGAKFGTDLADLRVKIGAAVEGDELPTASSASMSHERLGVAEYYFGRAGYRFDLSDEIATLKAMYPELDNRPDE